MAPIRRFVLARARAAGGPDFPALSGEREKERGAGAALLGATGRRARHASRLYVRGASALSRQADDDGIFLDSGHRRLAQLHRRMRIGEPHQPQTRSDLQEDFDAGCCRTTTRHFPV